MKTREEKRRNGDMTRRENKKRGKYLSVAEVTTDCASGGTVALSGTSGLKGKGPLS